jgi:hypothetical protein
MKVMIISLIVLLATSAATAATISGNYVGCLSEEALDEFITSAVNKDYRQAQALFDSHQCFSLQGREFSMVDRGFTQSKIRVYAGEGSIVLWTVTEATR